MSKPKVTVYTISHNYGYHLNKAVLSVLAQTYSNIELILINDASTDPTRFIMNNYMNQAKLINNDERLGFIKCSNQALKVSTGKYIVRLDADDWLEENAIEIMVSNLEADKSIAFVYPDYNEVSEKGDFLRTIRLRPKGFILDIPAHGACTMYRKSVLKSVGGYDERNVCQDGYDLWLRLAKNNKFKHINLPLFFYRQSDGSVSSDKQSIIKQRRLIKSRFIDDNNICPPKTLVYIPVRPDSLALTKIKDKFLVELTIKNLKNVQNDIDVVVSSSDIGLLSVCYSKHSIEMHHRHESRELNNVSVEKNVSEYLDTSEFKYDQVLILHYNYPFLFASAIDEMIDTKSIYGSETVIAVTSKKESRYDISVDNRLIQRCRTTFKKDREGIFSESGAMYLLSHDAAKSQRVLTENTSFILLSKEESFQVESKFDLSLVSGVCF